MLSICADIVNDANSLRSSQSIICKRDELNNLYVSRNDQDEEGDWEDVEDDEDCGSCPKNNITTFERKDKRSGFGRTKKPRLKKCTAPGCVDLTPETCVEYLPLHSTQLPCKNTVEKEVDPKPEKMTFYKCPLGSEELFGGHLTRNEDVNNDIKNNDEVVDDWVKEPLVHNGDGDNEVKNNGDDILGDSVKEKLFDNADVDNGDVDNEDVHYKHLDTTIGSTRDIPRSEVPG